MLINPENYPDMDDCSQSLASLNTGLVMTGGGARAAYQAGVLAGLMEILNPDKKASFCNPFSVITGTSAGAINATALACRAHQPQRAVEHLCDLWRVLSTEDIFYSDTPRLLRTGLRWLGMLGFGWLRPDWAKYSPHSFLDNEPLSRLLERVLSFQRLKTNLARGHLNALAITATVYTTGDHMTFYQASHAIKPWTRTFRSAYACDIDVDHLLASSAIPFVFPARAVNINGQKLWCGDGSMRQLAPISPAIHLGADKVFVISTNYDGEFCKKCDDANPEYPSFADIAGHTLSNIFLDGVSLDIERMRRINDLLALMPQNGLKIDSLRQIKAFMIAPTKSLDKIALEHLNELPRSVRTLFRVLGISEKNADTNGGALASYLLFESGYTSELIELGKSDCLDRAAEISAFFKE